MSTLSVLTISFIKVLFMGTFATQPRNYNTTTENLRPFRFRLRRSLMLACQNRTNPKDAKTEEETESTVNDPHLSDSKRKPSRCDAPKLGSAGEFRQGENRRHSHLRSQNHVTQPAR
ncbi:MAG: hypothetical protein U5L96_19710 [Owenweeksia sp.]|nr:hypothetical protein [Owenweeksia sp.]